MKRQRRKSQWGRATTRWPKWSSTAFYSEVTEPELPSITEPIPRSAFLRESWMRRLMRAIGAFFTAIINKIDQLLSFALAVLLLLLFTRFILRFFGLSLSQFAYWVFLLSTPLVAPFNNLLPCVEAEPTFIIATKDNPTFLLRSFSLSGYGQICVFLNHSIPLSLTLMACSSGP